MPLRQFVWACILCDSTDGLYEAGVDDVCSSCGAVYRRARGSAISVRGDGSEAEYPAAEIAKRLPDPGFTGQARCEVNDWIGDDRLYALGRYIGLIDKYGPAKAGLLELNDARLRFTPDTGGGSGFDYDLLDLTSIQPGSQALQIKTRDALHSIHFLESSAYPWEQRLRNAVTRAHRNAGRGDVVEVLPRITTARKPAGSSSANRVRRRVAAGAQLIGPHPWQYKLCSWIARTLWNVFGGGIQVRGLENIPARGPFIVVVNHQSFLEPMAVPAVMPRPIYAMAKTTQFTVGGVGWLMAQVMAFPVRRFEVDPHAIQYMTRRMAEGSGVMIFPEGERSWDGEVSDIRLGVSRLALALNIPVIPCRVTGAYDAWPRWAPRPQRHPISVTFKPALRLPAAQTRAERERHVPEVTEMIVRSIS